MARIRTVKPSIRTNEDLAALPFSDRYFFILLWGDADRRGRLEDRPRRLKAEILPFDDVDVDAILQRLHDAGFIIRYEAGGRRLIQVVTFEKNQRITGAEAQTESEFPPPETTEKQPRNTQEALKTTGREGKGKEGKGTEDSGSTSSRSLPPSDDTPTVLCFKTNGRPAEWHLRQSFVDELTGLYPQLDVVSECRKAKAKMDSGAVTLKTAKGMKRFLFSWMDRGTNGRTAYAGRSPGAETSGRPRSDVDEFLSGGRT